MSNQPPLILEYHTPGSAGKKPHWAVRGLVAIVHTLFGLLVPLGYFAITSGGPVFPFDLGQSKGLQAYAELAVSGPSVWCFYPFVMLAMGSMAAMIGVPNWASQRTLVRFGLYSGIVLAVHFSINVLLTEFFPFALGPILTGISYAVIAAKASRLAGAGSTRKQRIGFWISWWTSYLLAWELVVLSVIKEFSKLPATPTGCYIATASAHGHVWLVRHPTAARSFASVQLQTLKAAELALRTIAPRFHASLRRAYDRLGPPVAKQIDNPFTADVVYLGLKPLEWIAAITLRLLLPHSWKASRELYRR